MRRALNLLRRDTHYRRESFDAGLKRAGFELCDKIAKPEPGDLVLVWNRQGGHHEMAGVFEDAGADVLVAENGYLGKSWRGEQWFALALGHHAGAGRWVDGGHGRWDSWSVELAPWRTGSQTLILGQRGIGEPDVRSPDGWAEQTQRRIGGRIRRHPGRDKGVPLEHDLATAACVVTWHSGAALKALLLGVPVFYDFPAWIGAKAARPLAEFERGPLRDDARRLEMFRRLAWAMASLDEIQTGEPFARLLGLD